MTFHLRDYQVSVVEAVLAWVKYRGCLPGYAVAPGGSGKSVMIAAAAERIPGDRRVVVLARNEKLLRQNRSKFSDAAQAELGVYCSGLNSSQLDKRITIASVQSIAKHGHLFEGAVILADEAHQITNDSDDETQYWQFINAAEGCQLVGFTATPFRTGGGKLSWGGEIISIPLQPLFDRGHLVAPTNKAPISPDLSRVDVLLNEFVQSQLEEVFTEPKLLEKSVEKIAQYSATRQSVIVFGQSIRHLDVLAQAMAQNGMPTVIVDGNTPKDELAVILNDFEERRFKYLLNCSLLTTGFDCPAIDMVVCLRSTVSKVLFEQIVYRGTRPYPGKADFLLLDMGGNLSRHGGLGTPHAERGKKEAKKEEGRICPQCETFIPGVGVTQCPDCAYAFPPPDARRVSHSGEPDTERSPVHEASKIHDVRGVAYHEHRSRAKGTVSLRVDYLSDYEKVSEWLSPFHESEWVRGKCRKFFADRGHELASDPNTYSMDDLLWHAQFMKKPAKIYVDYTEKFPRVKGYVYGETGGGGGDPEGAGALLEGDAILF